MTPAETTTILRQFNEWRRDTSNWPPSPMLIEKAIDAAIAMIERLEAAEADAFEQSRLNGMGSEREAALMAKIDRLRQALMAMTKSYKSVPYAQWSPEMHFAAEVLEETK